MKKFAVKKRLKEQAQAGLPVAALALLTLCLCTIARLPQTPSTEILANNSSDAVVQSNSVVTDDATDRIHCGTLCLNYLLTKLTSGVPLSAWDLAQIQLVPDELAALLAGDNTTAEHLSALVQRTEENGEREVAELISESLTDAQRASIAERMLKSSDAKERLLGLRMFAKVLGQEDADLSAYFHLLRWEIDARVHASALNLAPRVAGEDNIAEALVVLTGIVRNGTSDYARGMALMAKVALAPSGDSLRTDIFNAIGSQTQKRQEFGLRAFEATMERYYEEFEDGGNWDVEADIDLRLQISALARNELASHESRNHARRLINLYFRLGDA